MHSEKIYKIYLCKIELLMLYIQMYQVHKKYNITVTSVSVSG